MYRGLCAIGTPVLFFNYKNVAEARFQRKFKMEPDGDLQARLSPRLGEDGNGNAGVLPTPARIAPGPSAYLKESSPGGGKNRNQLDAGKAAEAYHDAMDAVSTTGQGTPAASSAAGSSNDHIVTSPLGQLGQGVNTDENRASLQTLGSTVDDSVVGSSTLRSDPPLVDPGMQQYQNEQEQPRSRCRKFFCCFNRCCDYFFAPSPTSSPQWSDSDGQGASMQPYTSRGCSPNLGPEADPPLFTATPATYLNPQARSPLLTPPTADEGLLPQSADQGEVQDRTVENNNAASSSSA